MLEAISNAFGSSSEELIKEHKSTKDKSHKWQNKLTIIREISLNLARSYQDSKNTFSIRRYELLKSMIKEALGAWQGIEKRPLSKFGDGHTRDSGGLKKLNELTGQIAKEEEYYTEKSASELETEIEEMENRIRQLKDEFTKERNRFSKFSSDFDDSKSLNPVQRYAEMKRIIKVAISNKTI